METLPMQELLQPAKSHEYLESAPQSNEPMLEFEPESETESASEPQTKEMESPSQSQTPSQPKETIDSIHPKRSRARALPDPETSPEPFQHPSSPIHKNDSLTHENLYLLDSSLTLTDHGQDVTGSTSDVGTGNDHNRFLFHDHENAPSNVNINTNSDSNVNSNNSTIVQNNSSYVSFPSSNSSHSRSNSIVSSAIFSTSTTVTNNTYNSLLSSKRRRPRPWDNYNAKDHDRGSTNGKENGNAYNHNNGTNHRANVETTPLLASKQPQSLHSVKTAKRSNFANRYSPNGRKFIMDEDRVNGDGPIRNENENYGSIKDQKEEHHNGNGFYTPNPNADQNHHHYPTIAPPYNPSPPISIFYIITILTMVQFMFMALYNIFLHYQSHRLQVQPPYAFWFSPAGRVYNAGFGPNVPTLILFGAFQPMLVLQKEEWWRVMTGMFCCTSLVEFVINIWWLRVLGGMEEDRFWSSYHGNRGVGAGMGRSWILGFAYLVSCLFGGLVCIIFSGDADIVPTGLTGAGITGCMTTIMIHDKFSGVKNMKGNEDYRRKKDWSIGNIVTNAAFNVEWFCGYFLPYTSFHSIMAGALMGICCGFLSISTTNDDWTDTDSQSSSFASDLEEAFSPTMNTPPRYMYGFDESPPPPPSSSSKGVDTPIMRRSILTSPDEDDEYDLVQSLNKSGGKGLKQRNVNSAQNATYFNHDNDANKRVHEDSEKRGEACTDAKMRFVGMLTGILLITISVLYIGLFFNPPSEQTFNDSLYGCKTVYGIYEYTEDTDDGQRGNNEEDQNAAVAVGDTICGEVCVPFSVYDQVMENAEGITSTGSCSSMSFGCNYSSDAFDIGYFEIERELYTKQCAQNEDAN